MQYILSNTPIEEYRLKGKKTVFVKREDLCTVPPGPPFSKARGVYQHIIGLSGVQVVAYLENWVSMASWCVSWAARAAGKTPVIFLPEYKTPRQPLEYHKGQLARFTPITINYKPTIAKVCWYVQRRVLKEQYGGDAVLLPLGMPFDESIDGTKVEAKAAAGGTRWGTVVVAIGSGTICAGLLRGMDGNGVGIIGVRNCFKKTTAGMTRKTILQRAGLVDFGGRYPFTVIPTQGQYGSGCYYPAPFPCNPYYDRVAWKWTVENFTSLKQPVLFWNIGGGYGSERHN